MKSEAPWDGNDALRDALEIAGWRYAILIGITDPEPTDDLSQALRDADKVKYAALIHRHEGKPVWDDREAAAFVSEIVGCDRETGAAWLRYDWP